MMTPALPTDRPNQTSAQILRQIKNQPGCPVLIGLTGEIGAGKSAVAQILADLGARVIEADRVGHQVLDQPKILAALSQIFGERLPVDQGQINRRALGRLVFIDDQARLQLESVVHPAIAQQIGLQITQWIQADAHATNRPALGAPVVIEAALLVEAGWHDICDELVVVTADHAVRQQRVQQNRGWPADELDRRASAQGPLQAKTAHATQIFVNNGSRAALTQQITQWWAQRPELAQHMPVKQASDRANGM